MEEKREQADAVPGELAELLKNNVAARDFFDTLAKSYKKGYCEWVGSAKNESTRKVRAEKALKMLQNRQKTLKT